MNFAESLRIALRALNANKVRALLTMLGVIIGVAAVILLVSIGTGVQEEITGTIEGMGSNQLYVLPMNMSAQTGPPGSGGGSSKAFTMDEVDLLERRVTGASVIFPTVQSSVIAKVGSKSIRTTLAGGTEKGAEVFGADIASGRYYSKGDVAGASRNIVIGTTVARELFSNRDPVGKSIQVNGQRFTVIGVFEALGGSMAGDQDNQIYMPITTAQRLTGIDDISTIVVVADSPEEVPLVQSQIRRILRPTFGSDFSVFSQEQTLSVFNTMLGTLTAMLAGIAGISLLVGGIGIMNIMLVSVSERTREIGIRKAVGARTYDIMSQFVIEALILSVFGGMVGIAIGAGGALLLSSLVPTVVSAWSVGLAFGFSAAVGIFFGVYPAWKASRLDPIVALRYE